MPRPRNPVPKYRLHKSSGQAICTYYTADGRKHTASLGKYNSPDSLKRYRELLATLERIVQSPTAKPLKIAPHKTPKDMVVATLCDLFTDHAGVYYRDSAGKTTSEVRLYSSAIGALLGVSGIETMRTADFGLAELATVQTAMVALGWKRQTINQQVRRIRTVFRWGSERGHVPVGKWFELRTLSGLKAGRTTVSESEEVLPVSAADVAATLPQLPPTVARMVRFHRLTGCRPQDVCSISWELIDRSNAVWVYTPKQHKTAHHGHKRTVLIGPAARTELGEPGKGFVFNPRKAAGEIAQARRANRKTPFYPSDERRNLAPPKRLLRSFFTTASYGRAIARACERAGVPPWAPNQLRHAALTEFRAKFGLEVARAIGGHKSAVTTEIYAEKPAEAMLKAVEELG